MITNAIRVRYNRVRTLRSAKVLANTLVQFRAEETTRIKAINICERLGIDLQTYLRMCMSRLIQENGIPPCMLDS